MGPKAEDWEKSIPSKLNKKHTVVFGHSLFPFTRTRV